MSNGTFFYPNISRIPEKSDLQRSDRSGKKIEQSSGEFEKVFDQALDVELGSKDLSQVRTRLKFSSHASQRLRDRKIAIDPGMMNKLNEAIDKAEAKGVEDTLVITPEAALIVSVKNRTVITALDRNSMNGNVFTNIDGAVIV